MKMTLIVMSLLCATFFSFCQEDLEDLDGRMFEKNNTFYFKWHGHIFEIEKFQHAYICPCEWIYE